MMESKGIWNLLESCIGVLIVGQILSVWIGSSAVISPMFFASDGSMVGGTELLRTHEHTQNYYSGTQLYAIFLCDDDQNIQYYDIQLYWGDFYQVITQSELLNLIKMDSYYRLDYRLNENNRIDSICISDFRYDADE
jgi:hypothetical protein